MPGTPCAIPERHSTAKPIFRISSSDPTSKSTSSGKAPRRAITARAGLPGSIGTSTRPGALDQALGGARRLCGAILDRYRDLDNDDLLIFLSGAKGFHIGIPTAWRPEPSPGFNAIAKGFCLGLAESAGVAIDSLIYSKTRLFRAPNSRHPKAGLYKRRLDFDALMHLKCEAIVELARQPEPFEIPCGPPALPQAADDWERARRAVEGRAEQRRVINGDAGPTRLTAFTRRFIHDGELDQNRRAVSTFRVAAELFEFHHAHGFEALVHALLTDTALDSGLTPSETRRQIDCGISHARRQAEGGAA